jgi:hypothetical protein
MSISDVLNIYSKASFGGVDDGGSEPTWLADIGGRGETFA